MIIRSTWLRIAAEEWRYWMRSKVGMAAFAVAGLFIIVSFVTTNARMDTEREARERLQTVAEETFRTQPARHPHRMVHYGHYVFRAPTPLAVADPGVDSFTGTTMFLEGHKQNSATFAPRYSGAHAGPYAELSPAAAYQLLVPLLLIVVGFAALAREREAGTDRLVSTMAVSPTQYWLGKSFALVALTLISLIPLAFISVYASLSGESPMVAFTFLFGYAAYLLCWVFLITAASVWSKRASNSLLLLLACWVTLSILVPRIASSTADAWAPVSGKVQNDLEIARALRDAGDGHNANDPAFAKLKSQLLAQYDVDSVADLPINFRGVVAEVAEAELTDILNRHANDRLDQELAQARIARGFSLFSPFLALKMFSATTASTDLAQHHRFEREAEALRFSFVQQLNRVHASELAYKDDVNRSSSADAEQRTRVGPHHWRVLEDFAWAPAPAAERLSNALPFLTLLLAWLLIAAFLSWLGVKRTVWGSSHE